MHVDKSTKLDKVVVGDQVKAYVADQGHVTTLQRQAKSLQESAWKIHGKVCRTSCSLLLFTFVRHFNGFPMKLLLSPNG
jgi:hypothetical protein